MSESYVKCTDPDHHGCPLCTAPADADLEAAMRTLRFAASGGTERTEMPSRQAAALLSRLEAADRLATQAQFAVELLSNDGQPEMAEELDYALAAYRNPQPKEPT